jgi:hypothetical protein
MKAVVLFLSVVLAVNSAICAELGENELDGTDRCLLNALEQAAPEQTVGELRLSCADKAPTLFKRR